MDTFETWESEVRGYCRTYPTIFKSASNARQVDENGKSYIDFFGGAGVLNFGHNNPKMKKAMIEFLEADGPVHSLDMATSAKRDFIESFVDTIIKPRGMDYKLQFTGPTGTNAVEAALKLARKVTGRTNIIAFTHGFHGMTLGSLAATANAYFRHAAGVQLNDVLRLSYGHPIETMIDAYRDASSGLDMPAAILVEVVQCEGGVYVGDPEWLRGLQRLARETGALLIVDDIQAGCGRTGSYFSFDGMDLDPDIICLAKGIGGYGTPMALNLVKREHDAHWKPGQHTGTFRGPGLSFIAGRVAMDYFKDDAFCAEVRRKGAYMEARLNAMAAREPASAPVEVRGKGMIWGYDTGNGARTKEIVAHAFKAGLLIGGCGTDGRVLKFIPPLTIPDADLETGLDLVEAAANQVREAA